MIHYNIVVSRFNEDIAWTRSLQNVIIYNKGNDDINDYKYTKLPNVGREGHTYYKYIYDNYDNLPDYVIFLQGYPFDHSPYIIEHIMNIVNDDNYNDEFRILTIKKSAINLAQNRDHTWSNCHITVETFKQIFHIEPLQFDFDFAHGAQFIVKREAILRHPKDFYLNIIHLLENSEKPIDPVEGYALERLHKIIFTYK